MMRRLVLTVLSFVVAVANLTCAGDDGPGATETPAAATATPTASASPTASATPSPTATPSPSATPTATDAPTPTPTGAADLTGEPALDAVIEVVRAGDTAALAALMRPHEVKCTTVQGMGGPPKCWQDGSPAGEVPDGTVVESFPMAVCELEWQPDVSVVASTMLDEPGEWYASVSVDGPLFGGETFFGEPYLPTPDSGLVIDTPSGPALLLVEGDNVVYASRFCDAGGGDPAAFLEHPAYDLTVTQSGPAWEE